MPRLNNFPAGGTLFLDANIFLEHLINGNAACTDLFRRLQSREIHGITSAGVLAEVRHRLILTEAMRRGYVSAAQRALEAVRRRPDILHHLDVCDTALNTLLTGTFIRIVGLTPAQFRTAQRLSLRYRLLTNDALHIATMRAHSLRSLASADKDFQRVPRLSLWHP